MCMYQMEISRIRDKVDALLARKAAARTQLAAELGAATAAVRAAEDELEHLRDERLAQDIGQNMNQARQCSAVQGSTDTDTCIGTVN